MNILIAGVGGQGNILLSRLISFMYMKRGYRIKSAENIGMSQRGGSVVSFLRIGSDVGPIIPDYSADLLIGLELCEAMRNINKLKKSCVIVLNNRYIRPNSDELKKDTIIGYFKSNFSSFYMVDGYSIAKDNGIPRAENVALLCIMCKENILPFDKAEILDALCENLPLRLFERNKLLVERIFEND